MSQTAENPRRRWLYPVLFLSLAGNLIVIGAIAGLFLTGGGERPDRMSREVSSIVGPHFFRALEPKDRRAVLREVISQRERISESRRALRNRIARLIQLVEAESFDPLAVQTILEEQRTFVSARHSFGEELLLSRLQNMSFEERLRFADRLRGSLEGGKQDER